MASAYPVLAIAGPTASGKSALALYLGETFGGEIVNYDSIQLFRRFDIGTAKPSLGDRSRVSHHLIDVLKPDEDFNAGKYQRRAREVLENIRRRGRLPIFVGGTGLYLRAAMEGLFEGPEASGYWRERLRRLAEARGSAYIHSILQRLDPVSANRIAPRDLPKVIRALEVFFLSGRRLSAYLEKTPRCPIEGFAFHIVGLAPARAALYERIGVRVRQMFAAGLVQEVRELLDSGVGRDIPVFRAIGYRRILEYIDGAIPLHEAIMLTERDTRRYAKRQMTWFRRQHTVTWFDGFGNERETQQRIYRFVERSLKFAGVSVED